MANESEDAKPQGNAGQETAVKPADVAPMPANSTTAPEGSVAPAANTAIAAGPAPQVAFTPDPAAVTAAPSQPAPAEQEALIGSWLAAHVHKADVPYLVMVVILAFLLGSFAAVNADVWHHLATGRLLSEGKYSPFKAEDPFGAGFGGEDGARRTTIWINHSWLYAWISYLLYSESNRGVVLVVGKALICAALACVLLMIRPRNRHGWAGTLCVLLGILAVSTTGMLLNPTVISLLFLGLTLLILQRSGVLSPTEGPARPGLLWLLAPLFALWINLDSWFSFGPILVGCCLAGLLIDMALGKKPHFSAATLAKVLGVSVLACLANPYHIRGVLLLPQELGYLMVRLGSFWPESIVAGGRAILQLQNAVFRGQVFQATLSPVSSFYWSQQSMGLSVAGISFFVLLAVVAFSFYLCHKANPTMLLVRSVPAAVCGILALLLVRFIPLFAVVGAVIALLNVQEYLAWREVTYPAKTEEQDLWANMTRLVMGFVYFGLLLLAWPGWINNSIGDFSSPRRVAFTINVDPSLVETALFLKQKTESGELKRALNFDRNIASYCAWYAPDMHFLIDDRMQLFDREAGLYVELKASIFNEFVLGDTRQNKWREHFGRFGIDGLIAQTPTQVSGQQQHLNPYTQLFLRTLTQPKSELMPIYGDGKTSVLAWQKAFQKPLPGLVGQWRRLAFGPRDADWSEEIPLPEDLGFWGLYFQGLPQPRLAAQKARLLQLYFGNKGGISSNEWMMNALIIWELTRLNTPYNLSTGPLMLLLNQSFGMLPPEGDRKEPLFIEMRMQQVTDKGPPEAGVLALKTARQAVVEDPYDPFSHRTYGEMIAFVDAVQESHWANGVSPRDFRFYSPGSNLRSNLRKFQKIASIQRYAKLKPTDPQVQLELFHYFKNEGCWDMAYEHLQLLSEYLDSSHQLKKTADEEKKLYKSSIESRLSSLELKYQPKDTIVDRARKAFFQKFPTTDKEGRQGPGESLGLMRKSIDLLHEYIESNAGKATTKENAQQNQDAILMLFDLNLRMGNLWELKTLRGVFDKHPERFKFEFYYFGVMGDYARADQALEEWDKALVQMEKATKAETVSPWLFTHLMTYSLAGAQPNYLLAYPCYYPPYPMQTYEFTTNALELARAERMTMRGILALESGKTVAALAHFTAALNLAGPQRWFVDRGVAERYKTLLELNR